MTSNLYGSREIDGRTVSKGTVINFFIDRALAGKTLTVYAPGTSSRNFVQVKDVTQAYLRGVERMVEQLQTRETGVEKYEIASDEDPSVMDVAEQVQAAASELLGAEVQIELVENPRGDDETLVEEFAVDTTCARVTIDWLPEHTVAESIPHLL